MKKITLVFTVMIYVLLLSSCSVEEVEQPAQYPLGAKDNFSDVMMQRDSVSKTEDGIDPPVKPPIVIGTRS